jgi:GDP-4-dehydro-6-deoxy-D-mannose reductase
VRVLIVGGTGFVGRHLVSACREAGDEVFATGRPGERVPDEPAGVRWMESDLLDGESLRASLDAARPEGIVHLAGQANVAEANRDPIAAFRVNAEGTWRMLEAARTRAPQARIVVVTSAEAYGAVDPSEMPIPETRELAPRTPYGVSKAAADLAAAQAATGWGLHVVRMRPFNHVGPGQRRGFVVPDFASQVAAIERGECEAMVRVGNLAARRDFTDVRDVVHGYRLALERGRAGRAYNLCSGISTPIEAVLAFLVARSVVPIRVVLDETRLRPSDVPDFRGDPSRAREELGWVPRIPLEASLGEVLEEWRRRGAAARPVD